MSNLDIAKSIVESLGGKDNINNTFNCMTRMRANIKDTSKVNEDELKNIDGVLGLMKEGKTYQVVLGPGKAKKVTDEAIEYFKIPRDAVGQAREENTWEENKAEVKAGQKDNALKKGLKLIADIFIPLIPAIIAGGLFFGFGQLVGQLIESKTLPESWNVVQLTLGLFGGAFLGYFAIFTGIRSAEVFGATPALGGMIGAISIGANIVEISKIIGLFNEAVPLESVLTTGKGGIIGVIFGVWILSKIEKGIRKAVPDVLDLIITPFVSILITGLLMVFAIMPVAGFISDGLVSVLSVIIGSENPVIRVISGFVLAAVFLPMVLMGLHHGLIAIYAVQLEQLGGVSLFPVLAMAGAGQVGAALAIYLKAKKVNNEKMVKVINGALPAGFLGVGEPLIYGVTLPMFKPFITAGLGSGFGGAFVMLMQVTAAAWGPSGLVAIPLMQGTDKMLYYFIGLVISYIMGFIITNFAIKNEDVRNA
ncbi:PTS transporter subunit EIIC [Helcococcus kunzii]|uniref:PTS system, glucose-like IIB component n=1 Tax=Helcococcus kunzii ATCC 51366 TaxID=883114 RepID=H3NM83_9FIRM|nr:PTS transporter subunit EIIC [Helcococcus kunzii]EHR35492.1 PTS system, glucose-like IIB component [Helcococcus kunzii ATCC 51366]MCT1796116.1 PTS transporter subunit EIIC [Helcococcus kunzii]MCT1989482.1 PTS transporter subunit EIIC [Helcococcus kunzii]QZO76811.1 PTS transporter subunit EIIC [Helcococcus kunzii]